MDYFPAHRPLHQASSTPRLRQRSTPHEHQAAGSNATGSGPHKVTVETNSAPGISGTDETATGKGLLVGAGCPYCSNAAWEYKSMNVQ